ncbi:MAG TPA: LacI family DNA-binding transcriptional regulator [Fimbriimonas sp.]|nr:LacI family DNA-binding transcriptional regulator [Fimbriimonas sp.]
MSVVDPSKSTVRVTLKQVAREVGVSVGTVSVALNGSRSGTQISAETRNAILESAKKLGYRPNWMARTLLGRRTHTIGFIPTLFEGMLTCGPYLHQVLDGVVNMFEPHNFDILFLTRAEASGGEAILDGRVEGAILVAPRIDSPLVSLLKEANFPFVVVDGEPMEDVPVFTVDNAAGVKLAIDHLIGLGHRKIAHIAGSKQLADGRSRRDAFLAETKRRGLRVPPHWVEFGNFTNPGGAAAMSRLLSLKPYPTAVFCANDEMAMAAIEVIKQAGLDVPGDISVLGFDNIPASAIIQPALTTVNHPLDTITKAAASSLYELIHGRPALDTQIFGCELIVRGSTAKPMEVSS